MENWKNIIHNRTENNLPSFRSGDQIEVHYRVVEGEKERVQIFSGTVIARRGCGADATFTVRKVASGGIGVERIFPAFSPFLADVKVKRLGKVRRAKLYYLRERKGKAARVKEKTVYNK